MPIATAQTKDLFFDYLKNMGLKEINYVAIGVQDTANKKTTSLMSSTEWQKKFSENKYMHYDPLRKLVLDTNRTIIFLEEIDNVDSIGSEIMEQRKKFGIGKGIVIVERFKGYNYLLTLGTDYKDFDCYKYLQQNYLGIKNTMDAGADKLQAKYSDLTRDEALALAGVVLLGGAAFAEGSQGIKQVLKHMGKSKIDIHAPKMETGTGSQKVKVDVDADGTVHKPHGKTENFVNLDNIVNPDLSKVTSSASTLHKSKDMTMQAHALSKHSGRNPDTWGKISGSYETWDKMASKHIEDIIHAPGDFKNVLDPNTGIIWVEKRLQDGRGLRLNRDYTFKGFVD